MLDPAAVERIRSIFLHQRPHVTIAEAAQMLGWSFGQMEDAIRGGEIEVTAGCSGPVFELCEVVGKALELWPLVVIEAALDRDAKLVIPAALRTRKLVLRLPAYLIEALRILAADGSETAEEFLTRTLEELVDVHRDRLEPHIPGFAEAIAWPEEPSSSQAIDTN
jgi:hypothetical protein